MMNSENRPKIVKKQTRTARIAVSTRSLVIGCIREPS